MAMKSKPAAAKVNVNNLINEIRGVEADEERGRKFRAMITKTPMEGSIEAVHFLAALRWEDSARTARSRVHGQPGTARVLAVCRDEFGDASGMSLMRLRDRLSIRLDCEPAEVATMSLEDFLAAWKGGNATAVSVSTAAATPPQPATDDTVKRVETLERLVKQPKRLTQREKIRKQRNDFSCKRRTKKSAETWNVIYHAYNKNFPNDKDASPATLRLTHDRNCQKCRTK